MSVGCDVMQKEREKLEAEIALSGSGSGRGISYSTSLRVPFINLHLTAITDKMNYGNSDEEDDLRLVKASATLLAELEHDLPKLLWKTRKSEHGQRRVHTQIRRRDLDRITSLV